RRPTDDAERAEFANLANLYKRHYLRAVRLYEEVLANTPALAEKHRYDAACAAALAASGAGEDSSGLDTKDRARLRGRALEWLKADLEVWRRRAEQQSPATRERVRTTLSHWRRDT